MIDHRETSVVRLPIDQVVIVNPRSRGRIKFKQIVGSISHLGLKKPITVVRRGTRDGKPLYELVCGQGRLEGCQRLGDTTVPALVIDASREDLFLMSLAENLARRRQNCVEMLKEIATLKERGYSCTEISQKTDLHATYVKGILRLLKHGEHRLLKAVEKGQIPISIAVTIATSSDEEVQRALTEAYERNDLRGKELIRAKKLIETRRVKGRTIVGRRQPKPELTSEVLMETYRRETAKQRVLIQKSKLCETRLLFVGSALKQLFADSAFVSVLRAAQLDKLPQYLAEQVSGGGQP